MQKSYSHRDQFLWAGYTAFQEQEFKELRHSIYTTMIRAKSTRPGELRRNARPLKGSRRVVIR